MRRKLPRDMLTPAVVRITSTAATGLQSGLKCGFYPSVSWGEPVVAPWSGGQDGGFAFLSNPYRVPLLFSVEEFTDSTGGVREVAASL